MFADKGTHACRRKFLPSSNGRPDSLLHRSWASIYNNFLSHILGGPVALVLWDPCGTPFGTPGPTQWIDPKCMLSKACALKNWLLTQGKLYFKSAVGLRERTIDDR